MLFPNKKEQLRLEAVLFFILLSAMRESFHQFYSRIVQIHPTRIGFLELCRALALGLVHDEPTQLLFPVLLGLFAYLKPSPSRCCKRSLLAANLQLLVHL